MTKTEIKEQAKQLLLSECKKQGVTDKRQISYILATTEWETAHTWEPVKEAFWTSEAWRRKHLRYYPYFGRGFVQLTWRGNYEKFGTLLGVDFVTHPDLVLYPAYAAFIIVYGMKNGSFSGHKLDEYFNKSTDNWVGARHIVNGQDKAHTIASIAKDTFRLL